MDEDNFHIHQKVEEKRKTIIALYFGFFFFGIISLVYTSLVESDEYNLIIFLVLWLLTLSFIISTFFVNSCPICKKRFGRISIITIDYCPYCGVKFKLDK